MEEDRGENTLTHSTREKGREDMDTINISLCWELLLHIPDSGKRNRQVKYVHQTRFNALPLFANGISPLSRLSKPL